MVLVLCSSPDNAIYICTRFCENISRGLGVFVQVELRFLFSAHRQMMIHICTKFHENILDGI